MYTRQRMNQHMISNFDEEENENGELVEFYERNLPFLMTYPVSFVPYSVIRFIAVRLHANLIFKSDWQEIATTMGITDNFELEKIQVSADSRQDLPLFFAMYKTLGQSGYFGQIIKALLRTERYHILKQISAYIKELLESKATTRVKRVMSFEQQCPSIKVKDRLTTSPQLECNNRPALSPPDLSDSDSVNSCTVKLNTASLKEENNREFNSLQQKSIGAKSVTSVSICDSPKFNKPREEIFGGITQIPSAPVEERMSVLIQHTEFDSDTATKLSAMLRKEGMAVTTMLEMENLVAMDAAGALNTMFNEVDFIVPIVSGAFLQQIHPQNYEMYIESTFAMNNRSLYQLIMNEYRNNRCVNFRVRPVILQGMNKRLLTKDIILQFAFRLWEEVPKLVKILKQTKELMPPCSVH